MVVKSISQKTSVSNTRVLVSQIECRKARCKLAEVACSFLIITMSYLSEMWDAVSWRMAYCYLTAEPPPVRACPTLSFAVGFVGETPAPMSPALPKQRWVQFLGGKKTQRPCY